MNITEQSAAEYMQATESAAKHFFNGIEIYVSLLRKAVGRSSGLKSDAEIQVAIAMQKAYAAERFAMNVICGSVLQIAYKAIELYSANRAVPSNWVKDFGKMEYAKFCVGRNVRGVPIGLIVYAGRHQHSHFEDFSSKRARSVFDKLAFGHGFEVHANIKDSAFDIENQKIDSYAGNLTALMEWRTYEKYRADMGKILNI
jgi:hypothetical protein